MILTIDIGNTNIVLGLYEDKKLVKTFRIRTDADKTSDEYGVLILELLQINGIDYRHIDGVIYSSVVPKIDSSIEKLSLNYFNKKAISVGPGIKSIVSIKIDNPKELGADLLVGAVGAVTKYGTNVLIIDMGTAITFSYVNKKNEYVGGAILPGVHVAYSGLFNKASKLEEVAFNECNNILGKDTKTCIQSGMIYGFTSMIEGMIERYIEEFGKMKVIITGGDASIICKYINKKYEVIFDNNLLLDGLLALYEKNSL